MSIVADRVRETTSTTGTGTLTLDGAATGFRSFTGAFGNGVSVYYVIVGGAEWEIGIGTTGAGTLARNTVLASSAGGTTPVAFSAGVKDVFNTAPAAGLVLVGQLASANTANTVVLRDGSGDFAAGNVTSSALKLPGATSGTVTVQAAAAAGTWTLTLPTTDGDAGQVLTTDGSGVATWTAVGGQFTDESITPTAGTPYAVGATDVNKRLVMNSTTGEPIVNFLSANTTSIATGSRVQLAAFGRLVYLNAFVDTVPLNTGFNPNANGNVTAIAIQSDGKAIIGGDFTTVGGTTRNRIARLNTDGTLDTGFNPDANGQVLGITIQSDGKAIIGGQFTTIGGTTRNNIARLNTDGTLDTGFNPNANSSVFPVAIQSDGKAIIGGTFTTVGGTTRNFIARLNTDGTLDTGFNPNANSSVSSIAIQSDGKVVIGGGFTTVGGTTRNRVARLNTDGTLDTSYNPDANNSVSINAIAIQSDGKVVIGGSFTTVGGTTRNRIARLNTDGTLDTSYNPDASSTVNAIAIQSDGKVVIGGGFTTVGGTTRNAIARLNTDGTLDTGLNPDANNTVNAIAIAGYIFIGGFFTTIGGTTRNRIAQLGVITSGVTGGDTIRTPVALPFPLVRYSVLTLEKIGTDEWCVIDTNNF
jgi:uncharacterized delta-60 repeat protein